MSAPPPEVRARHEAIYAKPGLPAFTYWQPGARLLAGRNPLSELDVLELAGRGVTHVLDLREPSEWRAPVNLGAEAVAACGRHGLTRLNLPVPDCTAPSDEVFRAAADFLDEAQAHTGTVVYAHCRAGVERTATILAAWLARREGLRFERALAKLRRSGYPGQPMAEQRAAAEAWLSKWGQQP